MNNIDFWKSKIKENQRTFLDLENQIEQESCFEKRCDLACDAATFAVHHTTDIFASSIIENVFLELAQKHSIGLEKTVRQNTVLHIMTEAYTSGGHTRCVERWIQLFPEQEHSCVILNQNAEFPSLLREVVEASGGCLDLYSTTDTMLSKALKLRKYASNFEYVILHIHMDDPIALIAFGTEEFERPLVFFNHADHTFWLGVSISDYVADLNTYRNSITIEKRGASTSSILGIPVDDTEILKIDKFDARKELNIPADKKIIFSSGQPNKYDPLGSPNFYDIVSDLVEKDKNIIFYIAGADEKSIFWPKLKEKWPDNLFLTGRLDYKSEYPLYLAAADLVIDSYPVGGETSMIDAVKSGKPILTLNEVMAADYCVNSEACCHTFEEEYNPNIAIKAQPQLNESSKKHPAREIFFDCLNENTLQSSLDSTLFSNKNVGILNFHWENINFGAILTSYALNKFLNNNGWFARNINYYPSFPWIEEEGENKLFDVFRLKHLPMTRKFKYGDDLNELNDEFSTFIVGSDQVWRHEFIKNDRDAFFLTFALVEKKIISYAASFGVENINASYDDIEDYKRRIELFDFVGVREESGVEICSDLGIKSTQVCDPVFLLTKTEWEELADNSKCETDSNTVVFYTINEALEQDIIEFITKHNDEIKYENIKNITYGLGVEEWLAYIKNSKLLVTDSFHGSCFAIIFNKPFICVNPNRKTSTRMETLFRILDVKGRLYSDFDDVNVKEVVENNIDWQIVNERINSIYSEGKRFLENALNSEGKAIDDKAVLMNSYKAFVYKKALKEKNRTLFKYFRYKLFSKIATGRKRKVYKKKYEEYKLLYKRIKNILKQKGK